MIRRNCSRCGKEYETRVGKTGYAQHFYCPECRREYQKEKYDKDGYARAAQLVYSMEQKRGKLDDQRAAIQILLDATECYYCKFPKGQGIRFGLDHRVSIAEGGGHTVENLVACCSPCNFAKNRLAPEVYEAWIRNMRGEQVAR